MHISLIPYQKRTLTTSLTVEEVNRRLAENIEFDKPYVRYVPFSKESIWPPKKLFDGSFQYYGFRVTKAQDSRRAAPPPLVRGQIRDIGDTREIDLKFHPNLFMGAVWTVMILGAFISVLTGFRNVELSYSSKLIIGGILYIPALIVFNLRVQKAWSALNTLLPAQEESE